MFGDLWIPAFAGMTGYKKGRRDPITALGDWFRAAGLFGGLWIPAFAGMTRGESGMTGRKSGTAGDKRKGEEFYRSRFALGGRLSSLTPLSSLSKSPFRDFPAFDGWRAEVIRLAAYGGFFDRA